LDDIVDRTATAENLLPTDMQKQLVLLYQTYVAEWDAVESRISVDLLNQIRLVSLIFRHLLEDNQTVFETLI